MREVPVVRRLFFIALVSAVACCAHASTTSPCDGVSRELSGSDNAALASAIASQLGVPSVDVLQSFRLAEWQIVYVDTHQTDEVFLFYAHDPVTSHYVTMWGGAAQIDEAKSIKAWLRKDARGIPEKLASCFAWHVTRDRDQ
jgi:hypothetical protein